MTTAPMEREVTGANRLSDLARSIFSTVGILPILLAIVVLYFASQESRFYGTANLTNVLRQSTYLIIVTLGQALVLISGGFDLSVGAVIAVTSVVSARYMSSHYAANPNGELTSVLVGVGVGLLVGMVFGLVNGIGVARFKVSPFIMTLGMASVGSGFALYYTGGSPVSGMPPLFTREIGTGRWFEIPVPIYAAIAATILVLFLVGSTSWGRYLYAIGGNTKGRLSLRHSGRGLHRLRLRHVQSACGDCRTAAYRPDIVWRTEPWWSVPARIDHCRGNRRHIVARRRRADHGGGSRRPVYHHPY
jgi:ribose/xylose/arabinose/galactoside ABC-type transport system permease subunit